LGYFELNEFFGEGFLESDFCTHVSDEKIYESGIIDSGDWDIVLFLVLELQFDILTDSESEALVFLW
jgi:hypothetical protein